MKKNENNKSEINDKLVKNTETSPSTKEKKTTKLKDVSVPKLFSKKYTEKKLEKKIYKKVFIPEDLKFLKTLIQQVGTTKKGMPVYSIPKEIQLTKKDASKLKLLAKSIKKQKGRVKWGALITIIALFTIIIGIITLTKNIIAKKVIVNTCESIFEAKCDIGYVNISLFDSSFKLKNLEIANKDEPMKNLISIESINLDFDLVQLLRSRFVADELSIMKVETNTDRKYSGDISEKIKAKIEKKKAKKAAKEAKKNEDSAFMKSIEAKSQAALSTVTNSITELFEKYNPETVLNNCFSQMQTPDFSKRIQSEIPALYKKYENLPKELQTKIDSIKTASDEISKVDFSKINPAEIPDLLKKIETLTKNIDSIKKESQNMINGVKKDFQYVDSLKTDFEKAISNDKNLVSNAIGTYTSISLNDGKDFISGTFDTICYQLLGKYYPYVRKIVQTLSTSKNNNKKEKENKISDEKSTVVNRMKGRDVFYNSDSCPKFWIKKIAGSGHNFAFDAVNITNDMDKTNKPANANVDFIINNIGHKATLSIDTRSISKEPLILAKYNCDNLPLSYSASKISETPGIPSLDSSISNLDFIFKIFENEEFYISGNGALSQMKLSSAPFEPVLVSNIYTNTLKNINEMDLKLNANFSKEKGIDLNLDTDVDNQFISAISKELSAQASVLADQATVKMSEKINEITGGALGEINNFTDLTNKIIDYENTLDELQNKLNEKSNMAKNALNSKIDETKKQTEEAIDNKIQETKDSAKEKLKESSKNLLKNIKKN